LKNLLETLQRADVLEGLLNTWGGDLRLFAQGRLELSLFTRRDPVDMLTQIHTSLLVKPPRRVRKGVQIGVENERLGHVTVFNDRELAMHVNAVYVLKAILDRIVAGVPLEFSPYLHEIDPRTGWCVRVGDHISVVPRSPLFDPPGGFSLPVAAQGATYPWASCMFCQEKFGQGQPVVWNGGSLLWLCLECTTWDPGENLI